MRIEDLFVDAQCETGEGIPTNVRTDIDDVINGTHKTFRYMLVTGLLAAVTDVKLHPRCLQVTSGVDGAFDVRSFCQEVIVPFENLTPLVVLKFCISLFIVQIIYINIFFLAKTCFL